MHITPETQLREIVLAAPATIPFLEQLGIDYCCGGARSLAQASEEIQRPVLGLIADLEQLALHPQPATHTDWREAALPDLINHIVSKHHAFARNQLALILPLAEKVAAHHGPRHPELLTIDEHLRLLDAELAHHFTCEESILFPAILRLDSGHHPLFPPVFGNIAQPIARMLRDHEQTGEELRTLRSMSSDLQPPEDACTSWRALYQAITELERDLHEHIHLENNVLFPRAQQAAEVAV